jgi:AcrR family transcriptional regulator
MAAFRARTTTPEGREQRERILRAAMELFAAHGFRGASLDAVAAVVGISRQGVLHYFPSKTHLLLGVLDLRDQDDAARSEERFGDSADFVDGLLAAVRHNQDAPDLPRLFTVLSAESVDPEHPGHDRIRERYRTARAAFTYAVQEAQQRGQLSGAIDPTRLATVLIAAMDGLQLQYLLEPESVDMVEPLSGLLEILRPRR